MKVLLVLATLFTVSVSSAVSIGDNMVLRYHNGVEGGGNKLKKCTVVGLNSAAPGEAIVEIKGLFGKYMQVVDKKCLFETGSLQNKKQEKAAQAAELEAEDVSSSVAN